MLTPPVRINASWLPSIGGSKCFHVSKLLKRPLPFRAFGRGPVPGALSENRTSHSGVDPDTPGDDDVCKQKERFESRIHISTSTYSKNSVRFRTFIFSALAISLTGATSIPLPPRDAWTQFSS